MRSKQNVSMQDVANMAKVSKATVSKVLNNKPGVSEDVKNQVLECCEKLGYKLNWNIQDLIRMTKSSRSQNLAFILSGIEFADPAYSRFLDGVAREASENNFHVVLSKVTGHETKIFDLPPIIRDRRIDGILISGYINESLIELLKKLEIPYVILGTYENALTKSSISIEVDLRSTMSEVIGMMKAKNRKRIAYFDETFDIYYSRFCYESFKNAMYEHNLDFDESTLRFGGEGPHSSSCEYFKKLFGGKKLPFDAIVCLDFRSAQELSYYILGEYGLENRPDILVSTSRIYDYYHLPLPSIYVTPLFDEISSTGIRTLVDIIEEKESFCSKKIMINPKIEFAS